MTGTIRWQRTQVLAVAVGMFIAGFFLAAAAKKYQVTGKVLDVSPTMIAVDKGGDRWEIQRDGDTKLNGAEPKVGDKVTVEYRMTAVNIDNKK
jgi:hypothetical protein